MTFYYKSEAELTQVQPPEGGGGPGGGDGPPLVIWGPGDPRPTLPIAGWDPGSGTFPPQPEPQPPLDFWGPNDPRPTVPIAEPPWGWGNPAPEPPVRDPKFKVTYIWTAETGWMTVIIPLGPTVTPSKK